MLSDQQQLLLKSAANTNKRGSKEQREAVDKAIEMVQMMTPNKFYPNPPYHKPTKAMQERIFFDEPVMLPTANYTECVVRYIQDEQVPRFKRRDAIYIPGGKKNG
jgi:hypothetical protein